MQQVNARIGFIDIAKGLGIVAVVSGHTYFTHGWDLFHRLVYPWHMPLFFVIAGCFLSRSDALRDFLRNKFHRLILPYFVVGFIGVVGSSLGRAVESSNGSFARELALGGKALLYGSTSPLAHSLVGPVREIGALWFFPALFVSLVVARLLIGIRGGYCVGVVLSLLVLTYKWLGGVWLPLSIEVGFFSASYLLLGKMVMSKTSLILRPQIGFCFVGLVAYVGCVAFDQRVCLGVLEFSNYMMPVVTLLIVYAVISLSHYLDRVPYVSSFLAMAGRHSMSAYCVHHLFLSGGGGICSIRSVKAIRTISWRCFSLGRVCHSFYPSHLVCCKRERVPI